MKFFVSAEKIEGTCYHEFYKGVWDGKTFWAKDSLCLHDDILSKHSGFEKALRETISSFDPLGVTKVFPAQWKKIGEIVLVAVFNPGNFGAVCNLMDVLWCGNSIIRGIGKP